VRLTVSGKLLLTGFEPFGGETLNPSGEVAKTLDGTLVDGYRVVSHVLPVEWGKARTAIESLIDEVEPILVLSVGLASGRADLGVEKVAINYCRGSRDNAGRIPDTEAVVPDGPDAHFSTLPVDAIVKALVDEKIPASLSLSAGAYLCNYAFYCALDYSRRLGRKTPAGFIHVPATPEMVAGKSQGAPSMCIDVIRQGIRVSLTTAVASLTNSG
jgi:pyroglutamyl-peptidase